MSPTRFRGVAYISLWWLVSAFLLASNAAIAVALAQDAGWWQAADAHWRWYEFGLAIFFALTGTVGVACATIDLIKWHSMKR